MRRLAAQVFVYNFNFRSPFTPLPTHVTDVGYMRFQFLDRFRINGVFTAPQQ